MAAVILSIGHFHAARLQSKGVQSITATESARFHQRADGATHGPEWAQSPDAVQSSDTETISLPDWGIADGRQGLVQELRVPSGDGLDPTAKPPSTWPTFYLDLFDGSDNVTAPPAASLGSLALNVLSAWSFAVPNPGAEPPSFPVQFKTTLGQSLAALHNPSACNTVITGSGAFPVIAGAHHILDAENAYTPYVDGTRPRQRRGPAARRSGRIGADRRSTVGQAPPATRPSFGGILHPHEA